MAPCIVTILQQSRGLCPGSVEGRVHTWASLCFCAQQDSWQSKAPQTTWRKDSWAMQEPHAPLFPEGLLSWGGKPSGTRWHLMERKRYYDTHSYFSLILSFPTLILHLFSKEMHFSFICETRGCHPCLGMSDVVVQAAQCTIYMSLCGSLESSSVSSERPTETLH